MDNRCKTQVGGSLGIETEPKCKTLPFYTSSRAKR